MGQMGMNVKSILTLSLEASADLTDYQWHGMKMNADGECTVCAATTDVPIGILTNDPGADGREAQVLVVGVCPVICGEDSMTYADLIRIDGSGHALPWTPATDTTMYVVGRLLTSGSTGEKALAVINCGCNARGSC